MANDDSCRSSFDFRTDSGRESSPASSSSSCDGDIFQKIHAILGNKGSPGLCGGEGPPGSSGQGAASPSSLSPDSSVFYPSSRHLGETSGTAGSPLRSPYGLKDDSTVGQSYSGSLGSHNIFSSPARTLQVSHVVLVTNADYLD